LSSDKVYQNFFGDLDLKVRLLRSNRPAKTGEVVAGLSTTNNSLIFMRLEAVVLATFPTRHKEAKNGRER
jgi:hypothetical protein